jgi:hypothetical protein
MLSVGVWRMGLGCSGKILLPPSSSPPSLSPNRFSKGVTLLHTFAHCSILHLCHEWVQKWKWGAARHVIQSGISIRVYSVLANIVTSSKYSQQWSNMFEILVNVSKISKTIIFQQKTVIVGHAQKVFWERLTLFRTNSGPKSFIKSITPIPYAGCYVITYIIPPAKPFPVVPPAKPFPVSPPVARRPPPDPPRIAARTPPHFFW